MSANGRQRLTSWKEIAAHLGRDVRTVLRWEKDRGLPVHRVPGATGRVVFAYTDELDAWSRGDLPASQLPADSSPGPVVSEVATPPSWRRWQLGIAIVALGCVTAAAVTAWVWRRPARSTDVAQLTMTDTLARATNAEGEVLWTYTFPQPNPADARRGFVEDLNGDGRPDAIISLTYDATTAGNGVLIALDHRGQVMWRRTVEDQLTFGEGPFGRPWGPDDLTVYKSGGRPYLAWALHHHTWWPSLLAVFDGGGQRVGTFVNSGWIRTSIPSHDGRYLLGGGISNSRKGAAFAILDARRPDGASPEDRGSPFECKDCPSGEPVRYYVIPWSDIVNPTLLDGRRGTFVSFADGSMELRAVQQQNGEMFVNLSPNFEVKRRAVSDGYWDWHKKFEREGLLTHGREKCPFRDGPPLLEWTSEHGWREVPR